MIDLPLGYNSYNLDQNFHKLDNTFFSKFWHYNMEMFSYFLINLKQISHFLIFTT